MFTVGTLRDKLTKALDDYLVKNFEKHTDSADLQCIKYTTIGDITVFEVDKAEFSDIYGSYFAGEIFEKLSKIIEIANSETTGHTFAITRRSYTTSPSTYSAWERSKS